LNLETRAPAKLNLCLYVGPRRPDGLHEIRSVFQPITLADEVKMQSAGGGADEVVCPGIRGPNLAAAALAAFRNRFGWDGAPVRVTIEKHIPVSAGLGGGSADAAAVLRLAAAASQQRPPLAELADFAMSLGADVPSQLQPRTALVTGAGEVVEPLPAREVRGVLLAGRGALATASVYARADELGLARPSLDEVDVEHSYNDLQIAAVDLEPEAGRALAVLRAAGASHAALSGSGPAAFGLFEDPAAAAKALAGGWRGLTAAFESAPAGYAEVRSAS
jgi:4-diphosphocytidyl-2-C-methyl-D-erythritol kinase